MKEKKELRTEMGSRGEVEVPQARGITVREAARAGTLLHRTEGRPVSEDEVEKALGELRHLTEGGIF